MEDNVQKAEGEWEKIFQCDEQYRKDNGLPLEVPENGHDEYLHVRGEVIRDALTSATRAAEERKEKWIMFQKSGQCSSLHRAHPETEWEKGWNAAVDAMLRSYLPQPKLSDLPPPPDNLTK